MISKFLHCNKAKSVAVITSLDPVRAARRMLTPPRSPLFGLGYISIGAGEEATGRVVIGVSPQVVTGSGFIKNLAVSIMPPPLPPLPPLPLPEDSDLGRRKGSKSMPDVEEGIVWSGGPGVLGVEEDFPLLPPLPPPTPPLLLARLCFLYLT